MSYLVLVRHGESAWNAKGWWTGMTDVDLTDKGITEAKATGALLQDISFQLAYTSTLKRAQETLAYILQTIHQDVPVTKTAAIDERDYGIYTGKNKWEIKESVGEEEFMKIRRGWDHAIPQGESLKDVYARAVPYYRQTIETELIAGKNVLIVAHGNSLRALIKYIENIPDDQIASVELKTGEAYVYTIDASGKMKEKQVRG